MSILIPALIIIGTFLFMEFVAWFAHKYVMHGFLWSLHEDHHVQSPGFFEKNDSFFILFAVPSALLMFFGILNGVNFRLFIGIGIAMYGLAYFLVHDVFIHQRFKILRNANHPYLLAIRRAHKMHHKHLGKEDGECFGMLLVPWKYYRDAMAAVRKNNHQTSNS